MIYLKRFGLLLAMAGIFMSLSIGSVFAQPLGQEKKDRGTDQKMERGERGESRAIRSRSNRRQSSVRTRRSNRRHARLTARQLRTYDRTHKTTRRDTGEKNEKN